MIDIRCVQCRAEFDSTLLDEEIQGCPACGNRGVPANPREDQDWTLTELEWFVLACCTLGYAHSIARTDVAGFDSIATAKVLGNIVSPIFKENLAPDEDVFAPRTNYLSPHEIRIMTMWSTNLIKNSKEGRGFSDADVEPIVQKLRTQCLTPTPLTFEDEIEEMRGMGIDAIVHYADQSDNKPNDNDPKQN